MRTVGVGDGERVSKPCHRYESEDHENPICLWNVDLALHNARGVHHFHPREAAQHQRLPDD